MQMKKTFILFQMLFVMAAFCSCQHKETDDKAVINEVWVVFHRVCPEPVPRTL